jgi:hypothetical protein
MRTVPTPILLPPDLKTKMALKNRTLKVTLCRTQHPSWSELVTISDITVSNRTPRAIPCLRPNASLHNTQLESLSNPIRSNSLRTLCVSIHVR